MKPLWEIADFLRATRRRLRFGQLSRAPLLIRRVELRGNEVECEWTVRPADPWDASLRECERQRNMSQQALRDALAMRDLIFAAFPQVEHAVLRAFRPSSAREPPDLVIGGCVLRSDGAGVRLNSWAMKAKLCGLQFNLDDGILRGLERQEARFLDVLNESIVSA
jgi:hypothetical protein